MTQLPDRGEGEGEGEKGRKGEKGRWGREMFVEMFCTMHYKNSHFILTPLTCQKRWLVAHVQFGERGRWVGRWGERIFSNSARNIYSYSLSPTDSERKSKKTAGQTLKGYQFSLYWISKGILIILINMLPLDLRV